MKTLLFEEQSGKKKEPKPKLFGPDIFRWGGGLPREWGGSQTVRYVPRNQGNQTFLAGYPGILLGYLGGARKVWEKKKFVFNFCPLNNSIELIPFVLIVVGPLFWKQVLRGSS